MLKKDDLTLNFAKLFKTIEGRGQNKTYLGHYNPPHLLGVKEHLR